MEHIIQQITVELVEKITEKAYSGGISDIDALASEVLQDCKQAATSIIETICSEINLQIRKDKSGRKELGLVLKEKERPRELLTELGKLNLPRDYYYDKEHEKYVSLLDHMIGLRNYERVGDSLSARMVSLATDMSYAKSASIATAGSVSRQTVKNHIRKVNNLEKHPENPQKRVVKELHVYADEDHVHMQKPNKERGKKSKIVPLVTVTEGMHMECRGRNRTVGTMHFVDEHFDSKNLWKSVEGYIDQAYDLEKLEKIYVHGDGGKWIKSGLNNLPQTIHVMDGYHLGKYIRAISKKFPNKNVSKRIRTALQGNDKKRVDEILQSLYDASENEHQRKSVTDFGSYVMGNWDEIVNRKKLEIPGSCTEAQVSHVLSERFSRDPLGWSEEGLGKLTKLRVYEKNGGRITAADFKEEQKETYSEYADRIIDEVMCSKNDWSIFDGEPLLIDRASGTQRLLRGMGTSRNIFWN